MVRRVLSVCMLAALMAPLAWGGCAPCQELFAQASSPGGCCHPSGRCKTASDYATHKHCLSPALNLQQYFGTNTSERVWSQAAPVETGDFLWLFSPAVPQHFADNLFLPFDSPPDLFRLHSALLI